ncbi:hypothetical protein SteCoe_11839 [Stentor coeruleus]|uniref:Cyclic nucleotide-binding domain-containing protein n=1 Tax=Stentor coeruleus TaxID=5963 RepID=A0A1R2CC96_9CILI|nr:hypothetical protein SteCoe_11839 [Stentor coeruleus]
MEFNQAELQTHCSRNLNKDCLGFQPLFNHEENDESEELLGFEYSESESKTSRLIKKSLIKISSPFYKYWEFIGIILSIYSCVVIPFTTAFYENKSITLIIVDTIIDFFFTIDFILKFFTSYKDKKGQEIFNWKKIWRNYLKKKFWVDVVSTFPIDKLLFLLGNKHGPSITIINLLKILRLRRISFMSKSKASLLLRLGFVITNFLLVVHIAGCVWFIVVRENERWIPYQDVEKGYTELYSYSLWRKYITNLFEGIWLIFGQEVVPSTYEEIWAACILIILGMVITSYLFGEILMFTSRLGIKYERRKKALDMSISVINRMKTSKSIKKKVLDFITNIYPTLSSQVEFERLCHYISPLLQKEVLKCIYQPMLTKNFLFLDDPKLSDFIINRVNYTFYQPEEEIITEGTRAADFYILVNGVCAVFVKLKNHKKTKVCSINEGMQFGEIGLLYKTYRTATVVSHGFSTVAHLGKDEFRILTNAFPYIIDELKCRIKEYKDPWKSYIQSIFTQSEIFESLPSEIFDDTVYKMKVLKIYSGEYLFKSGEYMKGVYALASGTLKLSIMLNENRQSHYKDIGTSQSVMETENQENEKVVMNIRVAKGQTIKAEVVPIMTEGSEDDSKILSSDHLLEVEIALMNQGTLIYPNLGIHKNQIHKLHCKAVENSTVYLLDHDMIKHFTKESSSFRKATEQVPDKNYVDILSYEGFSNYIRFLWRKSITRTILRCREIREKKNKSLKKMLEKLKAIISCQQAGNYNLAEDILKDVVSYKYIRKNGDLDSASLYSGCLPLSHPILVSFNKATDNNSKESLLHQCSSLKKDIISNIPNIQTCKQRVLNSIGLMTTLLEILKK